MIHNPRGFGLTAEPPLALQSRGMGAVPITSIDLSPCYRVHDAGESLVIRCRHCSAGWIPKHSADGRPLIEHAYTHRVRLPRIPVTPRPIVRTIQVIIDGRVIRTLRQRLTIDRAQREQLAITTLIISYAPDEPCGIFSPPP